MDLYPHNVDMWRPLIRTVRPSVSEIASKIVYNSIVNCAYVS